ncbi:FxSxx-COOH system tetratricopeptide repeat protein [Nonomuraea sp. NPDC048881]|uniref:FxSxx-COOH system tetratricopeptide repeat protein n=1 Tax=Nonomuraea sp. NPDC048881 TaxID=3155030 RepID=UPI0033C3F213
MDNARHETGARLVQGWQVGDHNTQHNHFHSRVAISWPHRVGGLPPLADRRLDRRADHDLSVAAAGTALVCQVLSGLGGVGKTQLAARLAHRLWNQKGVDLLIWATATSRSGVVARYAQAAADVTGVEDPDPAQAAERLLAWLASTDRRWLVVLDDLTDPADLTGLWPPTTPTGRTVVTTRRRDAALLAGRHLLDVDVFTPAEAVRYLRDKLGDQPQRLADADALAADLGHLPLALAQAATYIVDRGLDCADYRRRLADQRRQLPDLAPEVLPDEHRSSLAATWAISINMADRLPPKGAAKPLLQLAAMLDPNSVPINLFSTGAAIEYCTRRTRASLDADDILDAVRLLHRFNLATIHETTSTVRVHALIQRAVREDIDASQQRVVATAAADALLQVRAADERESTRAQMLWSNTAALRAAAGNVLIDPYTGVHPVLVHAGHTLGNTGQDSAALHYLRELHAAATPALGKDHLDVLVLRKWIAYWTGHSGHWAEARDAYKELLSDMITVLGTWHPETLAVRGDAAWSQGMAGDAHGAVEALTALLADRVRILGPEHIDTLRARTDLARCRGQAGDPTGAIAELTELLAIQTRTLGSDNVHTLVTRNNIARYHGEAGQIAHALSETEEIVEARSKTLGPDHPHTLASREGAAIWQWKSGARDSALAALQSLLTDRVRILGPHHHHTLATRHQLARWRGETGHYRGAVIAFQELLADQVRTLGTDHPATLATQAEIVFWQGQTTEP